MNMNQGIKAENTFEEALFTYKEVLTIYPGLRIYANCFEFQLTQNQIFEQELESKYIELFQNEKVRFIEYEMLKILQDIANRKDATVESWKEKYHGVNLNWSFHELKSWIDEVEDKEIKARLEEALVVFEGHRS